MTRRKLFSALSIVILLFNLVPTLAASAQSSAAASRTLQLGLRGATLFNPSPSAAGPDHDTALDRALMLRQAALERDIPRGGAAARPAVIPRAASSPLVSSASTQLSFEGLKHFDQRFANGGNQFSLEPPDQALCVGGGFVVEAVNDVMKVYNTSGAGLSGVQDMNSFFGLAAQIERTTGVIGPFLSDPKCYYDRATQRWFITDLMIDNGTNPGATGRAFTLIAVSQTSDPTGAYFIYALDATNDSLNGTPSHTGCPCFGDQPLLGADAYGLYLSTNEFSLSGPGFNGAQFYAVPKAALAAGASTFAVLFDNLLLAEGQAYTVQPATSPDPSQFQLGKGGVEYALSALDFSGHGDSRIALWALSNTSSLNSTPSLTLANVVLASEAYVMPIIGIQKRTGPTPLRDYFGDVDPLAPLNSNDDRMTQTVYTNGRLWSGLNTPYIHNGATHDSLAYFVVKPTSAASLSGAVEHQGYIGLDSADLLFPALGVTSNGQAFAAVTVVGWNYYPSAGYINLAVNDGYRGFVFVTATGAGPQDGFTGYPALDPAGHGVSRWGDYSAAVADGNSVWLATEYIGQACGRQTFRADPTCGGTRSFYANWDTRISQITP